MANNAYAHTKEAVRVKVKKCELNIPPEWRKFSVDPQITSLEVLYSLLAKAFDIKSDFAIKYKAFDPAGNETYLAVLSDWDLDAAFLRIHNLSLQTASEPCLILQIDIKPFTEVKEWDGEVTPICGGQSISAIGAGDCSGRLSATSGTREIITPLQQSLGASHKYVQSMQTKLPGLIMNQMEKTFSIVQKAFNLTEETMASLPPRVPLSDAEFRLFLDSLGQIQRCDELRKVIFLGGIEPSLRRVVWKHILNVYPSSMTGKQRMDYMRRKSEHYCKLRDTWKAAVKQGCVAGELTFVTSMVKKDVLRTDRLHPFYAGSDDNQNIASLFNILTTYALNHPTVSYCQGMSDIASPLLVTMNDEAQAYICFCALMARLRANFMLDGIAMTQKFAHLTEALSFYDPEFWEYLKSQQADDLLFCYRWLLLELKREFPFEDALRMLEVQWSSLKYEKNSDKELALYEKEFVPILESSAPTTSNSLSGSYGAAMPLSPSYFQVKPRENAYTKVCALRRQSSSTSLSSLSSSIGNSALSTSTTRLDSTRRLNQSLDEGISKHSIRRSRHRSAKAHQSLDESKMLSLLESMEANEVTKDSEELKSEVGKPTQLKATFIDDADNEDGDDEVFEKEQKVFEHFNFHPTNPFIEDAKKTVNDATDPSQTNVGVVTKSPDNSSKISNAFLSSNSSSLDAEDNDEATKADVKKAKYLSRDFIKLQNKNILNNYNAVSSLIAKQISNTSGGGDGGTKKSTSSGGGHFRELKEKIAATSKKGMTSDDFNSSSEKSQQKLVKNFNEFLSFATFNKSRVSDKLPRSPTKTPTVTKTTFNNKSKSPSPTKVAPHSNTAHSPAALHPLVQFTRSGCSSSFDDSDSSSIPETTGSCSTAPTAIQQTNTSSNYSLQQELDSRCNSAARTPVLPPSSTFETSIDLEEKQPSQNLANDLSLTPEDGHDQEYLPMTTAITRELRLEAENLDRQVFGDCKQEEQPRDLLIEYEKLEKDSLDLMDDLKENEIKRCPDVSELIVRRHEMESKKAPAATPLLECNEHHDDEWAERVVATNTSEVMTRQTLDGLSLNPFIDDGELLKSQTAAAHLHTSNSLPEVIVPLATSDANIPMHFNQPIEMATNASEEIVFANVSTSAAAATTQKFFRQDDALPSLPPPSEFGGGNPFLMFLCLTLLLQHRNTIIKSGMDYNEIAMHFDKMVRKHDVTRVLNQARRMYIDYLKTQAAYSQRCQTNSVTDTNRQSASPAMCHTRASTES